jgi:hypothetical protein
MGKRPAAKRRNQNLIKGAVVADKEDKADSIAEGETVGARDADDIKLPPAANGAPLPSAMVHRDSHSPQTKAD